MAEILSGGTLFSIFLTLLAFQVGLFLQKKLNSPLCNPILIAAGLIIVFLLVTGVSNEDYQAGAGTFSWLLTPATVALSIPLYEQIQVLKKDWRGILAGITGGTLASLGSIWGLCYVLGLDKVLYRSLLPKSVTTAIGVVLSESGGGNTAIATAAIVLTGVLGSALGQPMCKLFRISHPAAQGVAFGTASHVIGTSKAAELDPTAGAVSSLSLVIAGILTAVLYPLLSGL